MKIKQTILDVIKVFGYNVSSIKRLPTLDSVGSDITYLDVGSSGGLAPQWERYYGHKFFKVILVEPDKPAADELSKMYPNATVVPYALGSMDGDATLNITSNPACSSILTPDYNVLDRFPVKKWFEIAKKLTVRLSRFDSIATELKLATPDFVKLDVQGYESEVLTGFGNLLKDVLCVELETHLKPIYVNQKTVEGMMQFMESNGFFLRHLATIGIFEDEVVEFNAFFIKRPEFVKSDAATKKVQFWCDIHQFPNGSYLKDWDRT